MHARIFTIDEYGLIGWLYSVVIVSVVGAVGVIVVGGVAVIIVDVVLTLSSLPEKIYICQ